MQCKCWVKQIFYTRTTLFATLAIKKKQGEKIVRLNFIPWKLYKFLRALLSQVSQKLSDDPRYQEQYWTYFPSFLSSAGKVNIIVKYLKPAAKSAKVKSGNSFSCIKIKWKNGEVSLILWFFSVRVIEFTVIEVKIYNCLSFCSRTFIKSMYMYIIIGALWQNISLYHTLLAHLDLKVHHNILQDICDSVIAVQPTYWNCFFFWNLLYTVQH